MRYALACEGPTLAQTLRRPGELDPSSWTTIAVNRAIEHVYPCDYWAFGDAATPCKVSLLTAGRFPRRGVITCPEARKNLPWITERHAYIDWHTDVPHPFGAVGPDFSLIAAILWAAAQPDAERIVLHGVDQDGDEDWLGRAQPNRNRDRWAKEKKKCRRAIDWALATYPGLEIVNLSPIHTGFKDVPA